jgi:hypothetical protein
MSNAPHSVITLSFSFPTHKQTLYYNNTTMRSSFLAGNRSDGSNSATADFVACSSRALLLGLAWLGLAWLLQFTGFEPPTSLPK